MTLRQTFSLAALTAVYLCFELGFNARLLDLVGSSASPGELDNIEICGRTLSGIAVALFALQIGLHLRQSGKRWYISKFSIALLCAVSGAATYAGLELLTTHLVDSRSPAFRRASVSMVLLQRAVRDSGWEIEQFNEDKTLFERPEGKAALALLPFMGTSLARLDGIIAGARGSLIRDQISTDIGGPSGYFDKYADAVAEAAKQYQRYKNAGRAGGEGDLKRQQDKAWDDYLHELGRHGWSPYAVPEGQRAAVLRKVRARVPVPADWDFADEQAFRSAVAAKFEQRRGAASGNGNAMPAGLSWHDFFAHSTVQRRLRERLGLPAGTAIKPDYDGPGFVRAVFNPMLDKQLQKRLPAYSASEPEFADGGAQAELGRKMARIAIVPPLALFCSLLGALAHLCKLTYFGSRGMLQLAGVSRLGWAWAVPAAVGLGCIILLQCMGNAVTRGHVYQVLTRDMLRDGGAMQQAIVHVLHGVIVGQQLSYPINEAIRVKVLRDLSFGFTPERNKP
jgi:hypothetical protein